jgi:hypothetical protein
MHACRRLTHKIATQIITKPFTFILLEPGCRRALGGSFACLRKVDLPRSIPSQSYFLYCSRAGDRLNRHLATESMGINRAYCPLCQYQRGAISLDPALALHELRVTSASRLSH